MGNPRILIVEDSKVQISTLQKTLGEQYDLIFSADCSEAISKLKLGERYPIFVVNVKAPNSDAMKILRYLSQNGQKQRILITSGEVQPDFEAEAIELGIDYFMQKPLRYESLKTLLTRWTGELGLAQGKGGPESTQSNTNFPFGTIEKYCYICGYGNVKFHLPKPEKYTVNWEGGLYPVYKSKKGVEEWDFLRSLVAVCPYCCFASSKLEDWADGPGQVFPYKQDAKKILSRTIATRKKMTGMTQDVDLRFDTPHRTSELAVASFKLAEKCMNGLILGEKQGTHGQLGFYNVILGCLEYRNQHAYFTSAIEDFSNQLKQTKMAGVERVMAFFFLISLRIFMGDSEKSKVLMQQLSDYYSDKETTDVGEDEKIWLERISYIWNNGVATDIKRSIGD